MLDRNALARCARLVQQEESTKGTLALVYSARSGGNKEKIARQAEKVLPEDRSAAFMQRVQVPLHSKWGTYDSSQDYYLHIPRGDLLAVYPKVLDAGEERGRPSAASAALVLDAGEGRARVRKRAKEALVCLHSDTFFISLASSRLARSPLSHLANWIQQSSSSQARASAAEPPFLELLGSRSDTRRAFGPLLEAQPDSEAALLQSRWGKLWSYVPATHRGPGAAGVARLAVSSILLAASEFWRRVWASLQEWPWRLFHIATVTPVGRHAARAWRARWERRARAALRDLLADVGIADSFCAFIRWHWKDAIEAALATAEPREFRAALRGLVEFLRSCASAIMLSTQMIESDNSIIRRMGLAAPNTREWFANALLRLKKTVLGAFAQARITPAELKKIRPEAVRMRNNDLRRRRARGGSADDGAYSAAPVVLDVDGGDLPPALLDEVGADVAPAPVAAPDGEVCARALRLWARGVCGNQRSVTAGVAALAGVEFGGQVRRGYVPVGWHSNEVQFAAGSLQPGPWRTGTVLFFVDLGVEPSEFPVGLRDQDWELFCTAAEIARKHPTEPLTSFAVEWDPRCFARAAAQEGTLLGAGLGMRGPAHRKKRE